MSEHYEGITIVLEDDYDLTLKSNLTQIDLDEYDVKSLIFKYEHRSCGCCEGDHCIKEINPEDLFDFVSSGGMKKIRELEKDNLELHEELSEAHEDRDKYYNALRLIREVKE